MSTPLLFAIVSGGGVILLALLFKFEHSRSTRFLLPLRRELDQILEWTEYRLGKIATLFGRDVVRQTVRHVFHYILTLMLKTLHAIELKLLKIYRFNKVQAAKTSVLRTQRTIFDEIREHKESFSLSEDEKRKQRHSMLE